MLASEEDVFVSYLIRGGANFEIVKTFATVTPTAHFYFTDHQEAAKSYNLTSGKEDLAFLKLHDEQFARFSDEYDKFTVADLAHFYSIHENPRVFDFTEELTRKLENEKKAVVVLFVSDFEHSLTKAFDAAAENFRGHSEVVFARSNLKGHGLADEMLTKITGIVEEDMPCIRIINFSSGRNFISKYKYTDDLNDPHQIIKFATRFLSNTLKEYKRSSKLSKHLDSSAKFTHLNRPALTSTIKSLTSPMILVLTSPDLVCSTCSSFVEEMKVSIPADGKNIFMLDTTRNEIDKWALPEPPSIMCIQNEDEMEEYSLRKYKSYANFISSCLQGPSSLKTDL